MLAYILDMNRKNCEFVNIITSWEAECAIGVGVEMLVYFIRVYLYTTYGTVFNLIRSKMKTTKGNGFPI